MIWDDDISTFPIFSGVMQPKLSPIFGGAADEGEWPATRVATGAGSASELVATEIKESRVHKLDAGFYQGSKVSLGVGKAEKCTHQRVWRLFEALLMLNTFSQDILKAQSIQKSTNPIQTRMARSFASQILVQPAPALPELRGAHREFAESFRVQQLSAQRVGGLRWVGKTFKPFGKMGLPSGKLT